MGQIKVTELTKKFGDLEVIKPTNLTISNGEFVVLVGPSGCGKSTMLRMIAGLEEVSSGTIEINGKVVNDVAPADRDISMVFQSYALYSHLSIFENIAFPLRVAKLNKQEIEERVARAAGLLQLTERLHHKPGELSGEQRQRVAIGRAIVRELSVFLFDEPLSNLDAALRTETRVELSRLHSTLGNTMIYVTHDQVEAMTMADKIVVLNQGRIAQTGSPLELYNNPNSKFVAGFIGNPKMNFLPVTVTGVVEHGVCVSSQCGFEACIPAGTENAKTGASATIGIRPDDLKFSDENGIPVRIDVVENLGVSTLVHATLISMHLDLKINVNGQCDLSLGQDAFGTFDDTDAHLFDENGDAFRRLLASKKVA